MNGVKTNGVKAIELTANRKVGPVSVTMVAQQSCPMTCPFLKSGCYAESGPQGIHTSRLNGESSNDIQVLAQAEADAILGLSGTRPLRLHVVGDCTTDYAAKTVADAATRRFKAFPVWGYTHAYQTVNRASWGNVSVLASVETPDQASQAMARGYGVAMTVSEFKQDTAYNLGNGIKLIPCPQQTGKTKDCTTCRLCWNDKGLHDRNAVIGFAAHGSGAKRIKAKVGTL